MPVHQQSFRDRLSTGDTLIATARTFGGRTAVRVTNVGIDTDIWPWNAFTNLDGDVWAFRAYEPRVAEDADRVATWYVLVGEERANVSFGRECAENGAFNTVYLDAFEIDADADDRGEATA